MRIFITGGAGFVGSNLAIKLKKKHPEWEILSLDNLKRRGSELNLKRLKENKIEFIHGDIRNKEDLDEITFDLMIECSAEPSVLAGVDSSPEYLINTNLMGTINCLELVRKNKAKIIFLSTSRVYPINLINQLGFSEDETRYTLKKEQKIYGVNESGINESFSLDGIRSLYGSTKLCSEIILQEYINSYNISGVINRCGVIAGPWQMGKIDQGVITLWVIKHYFQKELGYIGYEGSGKQVRDFLHIDDLYDLIEIQIKDFDKFNGEVYNIGGGVKNSISLCELTSVCEKITGKSTKITKKIESRPNDIKWYITDISKISSICEWKPKIGIDQLIRDIFIWIKENDKILKEIFD